ncbi:MAG: cytochrome c/FTR1 family iron permease [bacterium]
MKSLRIIAGLFFAFLFGMTPAFADSPSSPRFLVHLLDYLAKDYPAAVSESGRVLNPSEYEEQVELSKNAWEAGEKVLASPENADLRADLKSLELAILSKAPPSKVNALARKIQEQVIIKTGIEKSPLQWPEWSRGKQLFAQNCVGCHGVKGDGTGPQSQNLNPKPANFLDDGRMKVVSPFQAFNTIRLGIPNTAMAPFPSLSDREVWDLSFYVLSLRYQGEGKSTSPLPASFSLQTISSSSDEQLEEKIGGTEDEKRKIVKAARLYSDSYGTRPLEIAKNYLKQAQKEYREGPRESAQKKALLAYLEGVEPVEARLRTYDPAFTLDLEKKMAAVRNSMTSSSSPDEVDRSTRIALENLEQAESLLKQSVSSPWFVFLMALSIILREGFEAVLIIVAILGVLRVVGEKKAARWVHGGWIAAVALGGVVWVFSGWLMRVSGAGREMMEGVTSLLAVLVLLYVGFWLHSKTEISRWTNFIDGRTRRVLAGGSFFGLAAISFMAAFREAFETVLFLRALWLEGGSYAKMTMAFGVIASFLLIFLLAYALLRYSVRIPLKKLFNFSAILMGILAVILTGKGLRALQETGLLSMTDSPFSWRIDLLGFYPTLETLLSQAAIIILIAALWIYGKKPSSLKTAQS